jgi:hypothetical protein
MRKLGLAKPTTQRSWSLQQVLRLRERPTSHTERTESLGVSVYPRKTVAHVFRNT